MYSRSDQVVLESESTFAPGKAANAGGELQD
jgi:glutamate dehydrogenase/leucine dehydrogenase